MKFYTGSNVEIAGPTAMWTHGLILGDAPVSYPERQRFQRPRGCSNLSAGVIEIQRASCPSHDEMRARSVAGSTRRQSVGPLRKSKIMSEEALPTLGDRVEQWAIDVRGA